MNEKIVINREGNVAEYYYEVYPEEEKKENHIIFYRTQGGKMVHRFDCPALKRTEMKFRWIWAEREGLTDEAKMLAYLEEHPEVKPCKKCLKRG